MSSYEQQVLNTEKYYDHAMNVIESENHEILESYVTYDEVHAKINNSTTDGIDEG